MVVYGLLLLVKEPSLLQGATIYVHEQTKLVYCTGFSTVQVHWCHDVAASLIPSFATITIVEVDFGVCKQATYVSSCMV